MKDGDGGGVDLPRYAINPGGNLDMVKKGYSMISKFSFGTVFLRMLLVRMKCMPVPPERSLPVKLFPVMKSVSVCE